MAQPHTATQEPLLEAIAEAAPTLAFRAALERGHGTAFVGSVSGDLALTVLLPFLSRDAAQDELAAIAPTCEGWRDLSELRRAMRPACARDVARAIRLGVHGSDAGDGEYTLFRRGGDASMRLYVHNALSARPTEFVSVPKSLSMMPSGGSCAGTDVSTAFTKVRLDPWTLVVKTDDFTFAETDGGPITQSYWNGERELEVTDVPFATARASGPLFGLSMVDLRSTSFGVAQPLEAFAIMGCSPRGLISFAIEDHRENPPTIAKRWMMRGTGFAGRCSPVGDRTMDESASGHNYDDEGACGGWVLPLVLAADADVLSDSSGQVDATDPANFQTYVVAPIDVLASPPSEITIATLAYF